MLFSNALFYYRVLGVKVKEGHKYAMLLVVPDILGSTLSTQLSLCMCGPLCRTYGLIYYVRSKVSTGIWSIGRSL